MKKLFTLILAVCMALSVAAADSIDLSGMSFDELVALKEQINLAIWNCQEWQEVTVPQGLYIVGEDIPEGTWTIKPATNHFTVIKFGDKLEPNGIEVAYSKNYGSGEAYSKDSRVTNASDPLEFTFTAKKGDYIQVDYAPALFTPYTGKPDLGFK